MFLVDLASFFWYSVILLYSPSVVPGWLCSRVLFPAFGGCFLPYLVYLCVPSLFERSLILWIQFAVLALNEIGEFVYKRIK